MASYEPKCSGIKICACCHEEKPVLHFPVNKTCKDGLSCWCRDCHNEYAAKTRKREKIAEGLKDKHGVPDSTWYK